jgi:hypothetical protein
MGANPRPRILPLFRARVATPARALRARMPWLKLSAAAAIPALLLLVAGAGAITAARPGTFQGRALPSIGIFQNPAAVCESYNPWNVPCVVGG